MSGRIIAEAVFFKPLRPGSPITKGFGDFVGRSFLGVSVS